MALRKFLFQSAEGFSEEQAAADDIALGGLTMSGAIAMGTNKITGMGDGTAATDAVTLQQLDAIAAGIDLKESVRVATAAALPANTPAGSGVGKTITMNAAGILTIDGIATVLGDFVLIKNENGTAADVDNGVYEVTTEGTGLVAAVLTRRTDFDGTPSGEVSHGSFVFVTEGTQANTGWAINTVDPITVDTTPIQFTQFQGLGASYSWGAGLLDTANTISVELDTGADAQGAGNGGGTSGLEFDAAGDGGQLRVKVGATGAINRGADGLILELDGTTLQTAAAGASVLGVPSLFTVGGVAVGANVTAPNLDELTGGGLTTLHSHAGSSEAERVENSLAVDEAIVVADAVYFTATGDRVGRADAAVDSEARVIGIAKTAQPTIGLLAEIVTAGEAAGVLVGATPGTAYYLQSVGGIGTALPGAGGRVIQVGVAASATDLFVRIVDYGKKAA